MLDTTENEEAKIAPNKLSRALSLSYRSPNQKQLKKVRKVTEVSRFRISKDNETFLKRQVIQDCTETTEQLRISRNSKQMSASTLLISPVKEKRLENAINECLFKNQTQEWLREERKDEDDLDSVVNFSFIN